MRLSAKWLGQSKVLITIRSWIIIYIHKDLGARQGIWEVWGVYY